MKQQEFSETRLEEISNLKNQGQEKMLGNDEVSFEEVEEWGNKYCHGVAKYEIPIDEVESRLISYTKMQKKNAREQ